MSKPLDQMTTQELKLAWGKRAKDFLVGRKIVDVYYHTTDENADIFGEDDHQVNIKGTILKPNMVTSGSIASEQANISLVAEKTVECLQNNLPDDLPAVTFLSGGQSDIDSTANLDKMNKISSNPWKLSFSYGRALQQAALKAWSGNVENETAAQATFSHRAKMNKLAALGEWESSLEN